jgi:hypothetical protein
MFLRELTSFLAALLFAVHPIHTEAVRLVKHTLFKVLDSHVDHEYKYQKSQLLL